MISLSKHIDLGHDHKRMRDPRDVARQTATAQEILDRFFNRAESETWELQLLADEVGMGKTFVALAVAYSILEAMETKGQSDALENCYQKILIITPPNSALFNKWGREVSEFARRGIVEDAKKVAHERFQPTSVTRLDELVAAVRRRGGRGSRIVITTMQVFGDRKFLDYDLKRRFLLGVLFKHWGHRFNIDARERLLKGAPDKWPSDPYHLTALDEEEASQLPFSEDEALVAIKRIDHPSRDQDLLKSLLTLCRDISAPYRHGRTEEFSKVEDNLIKVYRALTLEMLNRSFPLVIVDEAHNWKNGPTTGANGYKNFAKLIASRTRRLLLLTATPFQLRPAEMLEVLRVSEELECAASSDKAKLRQERLINHCKNVIGPALSYADRASRLFSKEWSVTKLTTDAIAASWRSEELTETRTRLRRLVQDGGAKLQVLIQNESIGSVSHLDPDVRAFFRDALVLFAANEALSSALKKLVVRHRRDTEHRLVLVGEEYASPDKALSRTDRHVLHAAPGLDVRGDGELPHYLLMRCVTAMKKGKGRTSLGSTLTGCYSTLLASAEGRALQTRFQEAPDSAIYFEALRNMVRPKDDPRHPKLMRVVESTVNAWRAGEKTLIFCFRINTASRLQAIIDAQIRSDLDRRRKECLGGAASLRALRGRMTRRDGDLIVLGLDRVLLSLALASEASLSLDQFALQQEDVERVARAALRHGQDLLDEKVDRVFVHRAIESAIAYRLRNIAPLKLRHIFEEIAAPSWIERAYGIEYSSDADHPAGDDIAQIGEGGVHTQYKIVDENPAKLVVERLARDIQDRREHAQRTGNTPIVDSYIEAPSLWFGATPGRAQQLPDAILKLHTHLSDLTFVEGRQEWRTRLLVMQALRRALLRESVLLRLLPSKPDRDEKGWGTLLVERFLDALPGQHESMADRIAVFIEDVLGASGDASDLTSARYNLLDATRLRDQNFVGLVLGGGDAQARERIFAGFNTPLLPEVLICTSVGAEGIDLHRHCRRVVHYDLAWNPAVLEQRTGRVDRIGSKTFREREAAIDGKGPSLEVGVPFLAGTYDERMYKELRIRAQTFEVLTGGDAAADDVSGTDEQATAEGAEQGIDLHSLPLEMLQDLRARLNVWADVSSTAHDSGD